MTYSQRLFQRVVNLAISLSLILGLYPAQLIAGGVRTAYADTQKAETRTPTASNSPDALDSPLSIARTQTAYTGATESTITYLVTNNLPTTLLPDVPSGATITDTVDILAGFVLTDDVNTLRNVSLATTVVNGIILDTEGVVTGTDVTWAIGDLPPGQTTSFTLTVQTPAAAANFVDIDDGAEVSAEQYNVPISASARPAHVIPTGISDTFLASTVDADALDEDMLWVSAEFAQDPLAAFTYAQSFDYDAYEGSLRGTRGTVWGAAGNSIDQSSTLIAMLRGAGIPARYRHGSLSAANAQTLLDSMFDMNAFEGVAGYIPAGTSMSDPLNDADLLAIAQDHWWVEAYLPGSGWTDLDPSFPDAAVGDSFEDALAAGDGSAELPASIRHQVELTLRVESYSTFPVAGSFISDSRPLSVTLSAPEIAAKELILGHFVNSEGTGGLVVSSVEHTYTPYFIIDDYSLYVEGEPYQDLLTSFPLATNFTIAQYLEIEITDLDGNTSTFERTIKDLLGADVRAGGGNPSLSPPDGDGPLVGSLDQFATWVMPNSVDPWVETRRNSLALSQMTTAAQLIQAAMAIDSSSEPSPEEEDLYQRMVGEAQVVLSRLLANGGISFAVAADQAMAEREAALLVTQYFDAPRIFSLSSTFNPLTELEEATVDLRKTDAQTIAYPGQAVSAEKTANWTKGLTESDLEGATLDSIAEAGITALTTYRIFEAMSQQGIEPIRLTASDIGTLNSFDLPAAQYFYAAQSLIGGNEIIIPSEPVMWNGEPELAFWEVNPATGETIGVTSDGLHGAAIEYVNVTKEIFERYSRPAIEWYAEKLEALLQYVASEVSNAIGRSLPTDEWHFLSDSVCPIESCGIEQFFTNIAREPIELPEMLFNYVAPAASSDSARTQTTIAVTAGGTFGVATSPLASTIDVGDTATFAVDVDAPAADDVLVAAYAPDGWSVAIDAAGNVTADHPVGVVPGDYDVLIVAQSESDRAVVDSVLHTVTVATGDDLAVVISAEPNLTTNINGAQLPDAAFTVDLHNTSSSAHTFDIAITGIAEPELVLNGIAGDATQQVTLQPGELRQVGLYYTPATLPAPGTGFTPNADITMDSPALNDSDSATSSVPTLPYPQIALPDTIFAPATGTADFDVTLSNIGNASGSFALSSSEPSGWSLSGLTSPATVANGASDTQSVSLATVGGTTGVRYPVFVSAEINGINVTEQSTVIIISPDSEALFNAAGDVATCSANVAIAAYFDNVANAVSLLEGACNGGTCDSAQRDSVVNSVNALTSYLGTQFPTIDSSAATAAATVLSAVNTVQDNLDAIPAVASAVSDLAAPVCAVSASQPNLAWTPVYDAVETGDTITYTLDLTNNGTQSSSYALSVDLPSGPFNANPTVAAGATASFDFPITAATAQLIELDADVTAANSVLSTDSATAFVNVVDQFIQLTSVMPTPNFVETGVSASTVNVEIANFANLPIEAKAVAKLLAPDGSEVDSAETTITIRPGNPEIYALNTFNTSAFNSGIYTVTVDILDSAENPIDDGSNYNFLGVGQALGASHFVQPELVPPGTFTITSVISTSILVETATPSGSGTGGRALWEPTGPRQANSDSNAEESEQVAIDSGQSTTDEVVIASTGTFSDEVEVITDNARAVSALANYTRTEDNDAAITYDTFSNVGVIGATENRAQRSRTLGATATFTFTGPYVNLGLYGTTFSGDAEIFIDGVSQGVVDTYRNQGRPLDYIFDGLTNATHTISVTVLATANPLSTNTYVYVDYIDVWDGTPLAQGAFEDDSDNFFATSGFGNRNDADASDGHYRRGTNQTFWFVFSGTGVDLDVFKYNQGGIGDVYIDNEFQFRYDFFSVSDITETLTIDGLTDDLHVLTVRARQDHITVDKAVVPASGTPYTPPATAGITRYEELDTSIQYNGQPFTHTAPSWSIAGRDEASREFTAFTSTAGDVVSFSFEGEWLGLGFYGDDDSGIVEVTIDGVSQGMIDLYQREGRPVDQYYDGLGSGTHTVIITLQAGTNPLAGDNDLYVDFYESWDGSAESTGTFEANFSDLDRFHFGDLWNLSNNATASDGSYVFNDARFAAGGSTWFHFTGDSFTYEALANDNQGIANLYIDGEFQTQLDLFSASTATRTISFDGLGSGPHVFRATQLLNNINVDRYIVPAIESGFTPTACTGYCRHEENDTAMRYNGLPLDTATSTWSVDFFGRASASSTLRSNTANDAASLDFTGEWVALGLVGDRFGGDAAVFIDGVQVDTIDTYRRSERAIDRSYALSPGAHTISVTVLGTSNPNSLNTYVAVDYIDTWDGTALGNGSFEESDPRVMTSGNFDVINNANASGGQFFQDDLFNAGTIWFPFEGDSVTLEGMQRNNASRSMRVYVDGQLVAEPNQLGSSTEQRDFSFDGFGSGVHLMRIDRYRGELAVDGFTVPGAAPFYSTPVYTGFVRYEEDDAALVYNGTDSYEQRSSSWTNNGDGLGDASNGYIAISSTMSDTVDLTFTGSWINIGWAERSTGGSAEIFIDGTVVQTVNLQSASASVTITSTQLAVTTGTHTLSIRVVGDGQVRLDYIDVYDGQPVDGSYIDASTLESGGAVNSGGSVFDYDNTNATDGDFVGISLFNGNGSLWYTFIGDNAAVRYFSRNNTSRFDVYIDGQFIETVDAEYPFTDQAFNQYYTDLGDGPHVMRIENNHTLRIDGFESQIENPVQVVPSVEWFDNAPGGGSGAFNTPAGMLMGVAVGDINNDGVVEIVAPSDTYAASGAAEFYNSIFIYRGDGQDAGDGTPIIDRIEFTAGGGTVGREFIGSVALADLDSDGYSEIIVPSDEGMYALEHDGTQRWFTDTFKAFSIYGTPAIGNLDADPEPEIVVNMDKSIVVYESDGSIGWSQTLTSNVSMPILADLNGDTILEIVFQNGDRPFSTSSGPYELYAYEYNFGAPSLLWSSVVTSTLDDIRNSPAVADIDDDGKPEIVVTSNGWVTAFNGEDGSELWVEQLDPGTPGSVSIADIDGDNEVEIVTGMKYDDGTGIGRLYALNADGSLLWQVPAYDNTSANTASVLDVNGDGVYEIAWNGADLGLTIFNGADGAILYNEPDPGMVSLTATEYPVFADVDLDGYAEIVVPANKGLRVIGLDGVWGEARPVWNQHSYHITNVNDDLTIPFSEYDSWDVHNTYRTQFPSTVALPSFAINISHTVGTDNQTVDAGGFTITPDVSADPTYQWNYVQTGISKTVTRTIDSVLTSLVAGESRLIAAGTTVSYTLGSGQNVIVLPPLYVNVARLLTIDPISQTVGAGATAIVTATLTNPTDTAASYSLELTAFGKLSALGATAVPAQGSVDVAIMIEVPANAEGIASFVLQVDNGSGGTDSVTGMLNVVDALDLTLTPATQMAMPGESKSYTLSVSNLTDSPQTVQLTATGSPDVNIPASVLVAANDSEDVTVTAKGYLGGQLPFEVTGTVAGGASDSEVGILDVDGGQGVALALDVNPATGGPAMATVVMVEVTNIGGALTTFDVTVDAPAGWTAELGSSEIELPPAVFNSAEIPLTLTPPLGTPVASYAYTVTATAQDAARSADAPATATIVGIVNVGNGVAVAITPAAQTVTQNGSASWDVTVTNTGSVAETFVLTATGLAALSGSFSQPTVTLNAGQSQMVTLTASDVSFALADTYDFAVAAFAQSDNDIIDDARATLTIIENEAVEVAWEPVEQTAAVGEVAFYTLRITNTGNVPTQYGLTVALASGSGVTLDASASSLTLPPFSSVLVIVQATADSAGVFLIDGSAESAASTSDTAQAILTVTVPTATTVSTQNSSQHAAHHVSLLFLMLAGLTYPLTCRRRKRA